MRSQRTIPSSKCKRCAPKFSPSVSVILGDSPLTLAPASSGVRTWGRTCGEEINRVESGANYGWSDREGPAKSFAHAHSYLPNMATTEPVHAYTRMRGEGICIVGGLLYRGRKLPQLDGAFVFADWGYGTVWALGIDPASGLPSRRSVLHRKDPEHKFNPSLVTADVDGEPVLLSQDGALYRLEKDDD